MARQLLALCATTDLSAATAQLEQAIAQQGYTHLTTQRMRSSHFCAFIEFASVTSTAAACQLPAINERLWSDCCLENEAALIEAMHLQGGAQTEWLQQLYQRDGNQFAKALQGDFSYVGWSQAQQCLYAGRDLMQMRSLYYYQSGSVMAISTDAKLLGELSSVPLAPSLEGLSHWLSGTPSPDVSLHHNIKLLPAGYHLHCGVGEAPQLTAFTDFNPQQRLYYQDERDYEQHFKELFSRSIQARVAGAGATIASQMSGGLDSTSITALASQQVQHGGPNVVPVSHHYRQAAHCDESLNIAAMLEKIKPNNSLSIAVDKQDYRDFLALYPTHFSSPGTVLSPRYEHELAFIKQQGIDLLLTGNGGDEVCWGYNLCYSERLKAGELAVIPELYQAAKLCQEPPWQTLLNVLAKPLLPDLLRNLAQKLRANRAGASDYAPWLSAKAIDLIQASQAIVNPFDQQQQPSRYARYFGLRLSSTYNAVRSYAVLAEQQQMQVRHPFFSQQLAEFSFAIPQKMLLRSAYPKWILRRSMADLLPKQVCWNLKKTTFDQHFGNLIRENAVPLRAILADTRLESLGLIKTSVLLQHFDGLIASANAPLKVELLYAILTQIWLQQHFD